MEKNSVVVLDPSSRKMFRYNLKTNTVAFENKSDESELEKIDKELQKVSKLLGFHVSDWDFDSEKSDNYRRRGMWQYLLQPECSPYPAFIASKELSSAFAGETEILFTIDIADYITQDIQNSFIEDELSIEEPASFNFEIPLQVINLKVSLVSTAGQTLKKLKDLVCKKYKIDIQPWNKDNKLVFKVKGKKEYFTSKVHFLAYRCVRDSLRNMQNLYLKLTEIPRYPNDDFPVFVNDKELIRNQSSYLMFYPPGDPFGEILTPKQTKPRHFLLKSKKPAREREINLKKIIEGIPGPLQMYSGEIDWPFRVRLSGIENVYRLFIDALRGNAAKNGTDHPHYVVFPTVLSEKKHGKTMKKPEKNKERRSSLPFMKPKSNSSSRTISDELFSNYASHGPESSIFLMQNEFKLPFTPHFISFDAMLLYGDEILSKCFVRTECTPFKFNSRPQENIVFPIKVSNIPKETRLGVNIYAVSYQGDAFLIGSVTKNVFDEQAELLQGLITLSLWPFYKVEPRLACMDEFRGISADFRSVSLGEHSDFMYRYLKSATLYVNFDKYPSKVIWSEKDIQFLKKTCKTFPTLTRKTRIFLRTLPKNNIKPEDNTKKINFLVNNKITEYEETETEDKKLIKSKPQIDDLANLEKALSIDPLEPISEDSKKLIFICRDHYKGIPLALQLFLRAVDWTRPLQRNEAHIMLSKWSKMHFEDILSLLNAEYADEEVRVHATQCISQISDDDFVLFMPQMIQALAFETCHFSALGELLLERSLKSPHIVGHSLFWGLRSQLYVKATAERFGLILEQFLMLCGNYRDQLLKEVQFMDMIFELNSKSPGKDFLTKQRHFLHLLNEKIDRFPNYCTLPIDSSLETGEPFIEECKVMDSKKMPLWVTMRSSEENLQIPIIFKIGDDLRQDVLTLQMIKLMDMIWLEDGLDLHIKSYRVVVTGDQSGIIEVVPNSETTSSIQSYYGGKFGALSKKPLKAFLKEHNPDKSQRIKAYSNFIKSCAGYCVASYILGIADRHNGNIMINHTGHLFHIDFGHFLGNFKRKFGIKRERSNFVFTEEMAFVMGGKKSEGFEAFKKYCSRAYNLVRKHGWRIMNLFKLMISAGMPELQYKEEISYIRDMLSLKLTESEAVDKFNEEIDTALNNTFRRVDNLIHNIIRN